MHISVSLCYPAEKNIGERVATRVLEREAELVGRIQARWRGVSVRRYLIVFRRELRRSREVRTSMIFRIQRTVRGWSHRKRAGTYRSRRAGKDLLGGYLAERTAKNDDDACVRGKTRLRKAYVTERYASTKLSPTVIVVCMTSPPLVWLYLARIRLCPTARRFFAKDA